MDAEFEGDAGSATLSGWAAIGCCRRRRRQDAEAPRVLRAGEDRPRGGAIADYGAAGIADDDVGLTHGASRNSLIGC